MKQFVIIVLAFISLSVSAQEKAKADGIVKRVQTEVEGEGTVEIIHYNSLLDSLMNVHVLYNKQRGVSGYRILVFAEGGQQGRDRMYEIRADFVSYFPDLTYYESLDNLQWKFKVGDYRSKEDAFKIFCEIKAKYKDAILVPDVINYPVLE